MKFKLKYLSFLVIIIFSLLSNTDRYSSGSVFYLGTDKSFNVNDNVYVNLEGNGYTTYQFRVYKIKDPKDFLRDKIEKRLVKEKNEKVFANPVALLKTSWNYFKEDFKEVARKELNSKTRVHIKNSANIKFGAGDTEINLAESALLENHEFITSFDIPEIGRSWTYRKIPIPVQEAGFYLIEAVSSSHIAYTVVIKSNVNFVTKQSDGQTVIYAAEKDTGRPVGEAKLTLYDVRTGAIIAAGETEDTGVYSVNKKTPMQTLILLQHKKDYAVSDPDFYAKSFYGKGGTRSIIYTDRPIYKPGHEVQFKGVVRNFQGSDYEISSGSGTVDVITENGKVVVENIPIRASSEMGTFSGKFYLPEDDNVYLGVYHLVLKYGGGSFSTEFQVEAYTKPAFLVKVKTDKNIYIQNESIPVKIQANYYYGAPVAGARVQYRVFRKARYEYSPVGTLAFFDEAKNYLSSAPPRKSDLILDKTTKLDSNGVLSFSFTPKSFEEDSTYTILARVSDANESLSGSASVSVNRGAFFIRVSSDSRVFNPEDSVKISANLIPFHKNLNAAEKAKVIENRKVKLTLYTRGFTNISKEKDRTEVLTKSAKTNAEGKITFNFKLPGKGHYIAEFSSKDSSGEEIKALTTFWASAKTDSIKVPFKNLTLKSGKDIYSVGETAEILILSPVADGHLFITQEANKILKYETVELKGNVYKYKTKIHKSMTPNFTITVTQFAGNDVYKSEIKIVAPPQDKMVTVNLTHDKNEYRPGDTVTLNVSTENYKNKAVPAEVSISVVDDAIYQLQADKNPSLLTFFYHPRRNNVQTTLSSAYRFFGYSEEKRLKLALLTDKKSGMAAIKDDSLKEREDFKDTAFWKAKVETGPDGKAVVRFVLPANITTWRVNAIAVTKDTSVGQKQVKFISKKNLMIIAKFPPYLLRDQEQVVSANVVNLTNEKITADVSLRGEKATVLNKAKTTITLNAMENKHIYFTIKPKKKNNKEEIKLTFKAVSSKFTDTVKHKIPLRHFGIERVETVAFKLKKGNSANSATIKVASNYSEPNLNLQFSPGYGVVVKQALVYLADYPYGCVEQTMSRFMPLLAAKQVGFISHNLKKELPDMVKKGLSLLQQQQNSDGGFGWFDDLQSDPIMSAYVYRGLSLSKKLGESVDDSMLNRARKFLYSALAKGDPSPIYKAYILYSLSEGGPVEQSMIDKLTEDVNKQNAYGKALTALVLIHHDEKQKAKAIFFQALKESGFSKNPSMKFAAFTQESLETDQVETAAALLTAALRLNVDKNIVEDLSSLLLLNRNEFAWKNSRDTASAVLALSERIEKIKDNSAPSDIVVLVNGKEVTSFTASPEEIHEGDALITIKSSDLKNGKNVISIKKSAGANLFVIGSLSFFDKSKSFQAEDKGFTVKRTYYKIITEKNKSEITLKATNSTQFNPGDLVMVSLEVQKTDQGGKYIQIEDPVLPGFSVVRKDKNYFTEEFSLEYNYRQIFSHKTVFLIEGPVRKFTIRYFLNANLPGKYKAMPAVSKLMYFPDISGRTSDQNIEIKE
ncbi:MAG: MG2 domain-containing protein [Leptospirales bacterium]